MKMILSIWMQPIYARLNASTRADLWLMLGLLGLMPPGLTVLLAALKSDWTRIPFALLLGVGFSLCLFVFLWFVLLVPSMAMQYSPSNAGLVPQLKRPMLWALGIPVMIIPGFMAAFLGINKGGFSLQAWLICLLAMLSYIATMRNKWAVFVLIFMTQIPMLFGKDNKWQELSLWNHPVLVLILGTGITVLVLQWMFSRRGDQHFQRQQELALMRKGMNGNENQANNNGLKFINPYAYLLRRCLEKVASATASAEKLMPFSMGVQVFWLTSFLSMVVMGLGFTVYFMFFIYRSSNPDATESAIPYFTAMVSFIMLPFLYVSIVRASIYQTRTEQGLLHLAPALPRQHQQTKLWLSFLLRQFFTLWVVTTLIVVILAYFSPASESIVQAFWIASFCVFPLSVMSLKNYAVMKSRYESVLLAALVVPAILGNILCPLHFRFPQFPVWVICGLLAATTGLILRWRWQQLMKVAAVFPTGRAA